LGRAIGGQYVHHLVRGEILLALAQAEAMQRLGATRRDPILISLGHRSAGHSRLALGEFAEAVRELEQSRVRFDPAHRRAFFALGGEVDSHVATLALLSWALSGLGYLDQAHGLREAALAESRQLTHAFTLAFALTIACYCACSEGAANEVLLRATELQAISTEYAFAHGKAIAEIFRGWSLTMAGRAAEGFAQLTEGLVAYRSTGAVVNLPYFLTLFAESSRAALRHVEWQYFDEATRIVEATQNRWAEAEMHRIRAELELSRGDRAVAEHGYHQALAKARRQDAKLWQLRASTDLARLWRDQGNRTEARDLLAPIYGWFTEGFDAPILKEAKALLEELS
jgi:predicted ATPase